MNSSYIVSFCMFRVHFILLEFNILSKVGRSPSKSDSIKWGLNQHREPCCILVLHELLKRVMDCMSFYTCILEFYFLYVHGLLFWSCIISMCIDYIYMTTFYRSRTGMTSKTWAAHDTVAASVKLLTLVITTGSKTCRRRGRTDCCMGVKARSIVPWISSHSACVQLLTEVGSCSSFFLTCVAQ